MTNPNLPTCPSHGPMTDEETLKLASDFGDIIAEFQRFTGACSRQMAYVMLVQVYQFHEWCEENVKLQNDPEWKLDLPAMLERAPELGKKLQAMIAESQAKAEAGPEIKVMHFDDIDELAEFLNASNSSPKKPN